MAEVNPPGWWRRFLALPNDSLPKTLGVAFLVALCCAAAVSGTAVMLAPLYKANLERDRQARLAEVLAGLPGLADILQGADVDALETIVVDLGSGEPAAGIDPATYDFRAAATDPDASDALAPADDIAGIGRRPRYAPVYLVRSGGRLALLVLPVYGKGYQSTIHAFLALSADLERVAALSIYEQGETPGLGTRITDPAWLARWHDRQVYDDQGKIVLSVVRGAASAPYEVDGISGATRSATGVANLIRFWLGDKGFGPFLAHMRSGGP
jgi:Na+-transporting NADH:ubiquinone oxidoreductase subunit C